MTEYKCNSTKNIYALSELCFDTQNSNTVIECIAPRDNTVSALRYAEASWYAFVSVVSIVGNLATLFSVSFEETKKLHGFHCKFREITIFILHLCFVDMFLALFCILPSSVV